jgi:VanZ family protein
MALIFSVSSLPGKDVPPLFPYQDIVYHFLVYLALGLFFSRALLRTNDNLPTLKIFVFTVVFAAVYGISDEFHQTFVPGRTACGFDVFIDTIGGFTGAKVFSWLA